MLIGPTRRFITQNYLRRRHWKGTFGKRQTGNENLSCFALVVLIVYGLVSHIISLLPL